MIDRSHGDRYLLNWTREQKYVFPEGERDALLAWLRHRFRPDAAFPVNRVVTLYYDTPSFEFYRQKRNSEYLKAKVRLRWYENGDGTGAGEEAAAGAGQPGERRCFLEVKQRCGSLRRKGRLSVALAADELDGDPFGGAALRRLARRVPELGFHSPGTLVPLLEIRYRRHRFVDAASGTRLALDAAIRCSRANNRLLPFPTPARLSAGVLELKGAFADEPRALGLLGHRLVRSSFSKYGSCFDALTQPLGVRN